MSDRDGRLHQFFAGYFNQDWDVSGAMNWSEVLDEYISQNDTDDILSVRNDLLGWLSASEPGTRLPAELGCEYDPGPDGLDDRSWVEALVGYLDTKVRS
jgi:hypothetical protein